MKHFVQMGDAGDTAVNFCIRNECDTPAALRSSCNNPACQAAMPDCNKDSGERASLVQRINILMRHSGWALTPLA
jgi:hypothetical protein